MHCGIKEGDKLMHCGIHFHPLFNPIMHHISGRNLILTKWCPSPHGNLRLSILYNLSSYIILTSSLSILSRTSSLGAPVTFMMRVNWSMSKQVQLRTFYLKLIRWIAVRISMILKFTHDPKLTLNPQVLEISHIWYSIPCNDSIHIKQVQRSKLTKLGDPWTQWIDWQEVSAR